MNSWDYDDIVCSRHIQLGQHGLDIQETGFSRPLWNFAVLTYMESKIGKHCTLLGMLLKCTAQTRNGKIPSIRKYITWSTRPWHSRNWICKAIMEFCKVKQVNIVLCLECFLQPNGEMAKYHLLENGCKRSHRRVINCVHLSFERNLLLHQW